MSNALKFASACGAPTLYVDDVFSAYTYEGNGSTQTTTNGIDLAGDGGLTWIKKRSAAGDHNIYDTVRGATKVLSSNNTNGTGTDGSGLTAFNSNGFDIGVSLSANLATYISWSFRNANRFFNHSQVVKSGGSNATAAFPGLGTLGMVIVRETVTGGSWYVWHRSLTAGKLLILETTAAEATLGHITVSGTTVTLVDAVIANGTYIVYAWAHDTASDGIIQCGSFTTDGSGNATVTLGWEPQYLLYKSKDIAATWGILDVSRGFSVTDTRVLFPNTSDAESVSTTMATPSAHGFIIQNSGLAASQTYIYLAIRRSNKPPTVGTQVYNAIARAGTGAEAAVTGVGFAPDLVALHSRSGATGGRWEDRLRGATQELVAETTAAEAAVAQSVISFNMDGISIGTDGDWNTNTATYINHFFKRAPGVHDQICHTGTGANKTEAHNLAAAAELWLNKGRSGATEWVWGSSLLANTQKIVMPSPNGVVTDATAWNSTYPTSSVISFGTAAAVNTVSATYVTYLWATLAGISKVFTYTGDGGSGKVIDCGFTTGARFVMIIRTTASTAQDIFIWDTVRGIIAGNDPHLSLNTTAAEVTTDDSIDPDTSGFAVNQVAATNINVTGAVYIGVAYA